MVRPTRGHRGTGRFRLCAHTPDARRARLPGARRPVQGGRTCAADTRGLGAPPLELGHGFRISSTVKRDPSGCRRPPETLHARFSCVFRSRRRRWLTRLSLARDPGSPQPPTLERAESAPGPASSLSKKLPAGGKAFSEEDTDVEAGGEAGRVWLPTRLPTERRGFRARLFPTLLPHGGPSGGTPCPQVLSLVRGEEGLLYPAAPRSPPLNISGAVRSPPQRPAPASAGGRPRPPAPPRPLPQPLIPPQPGPCAEGGERTLPPPSRAAQLLFNVTPALQ